MTIPSPRSSGEFSLPAVLDAQAATPLLQALTEQRGQDIRLDGAEVQRVGGQCLQVLIAAQSAWRSDSCLMAIVNPSPELQAGLVQLGVGAGSPLLQLEYVS